MRAPRYRKLAPPSGSWYQVREARFSQEVMCLEVKCMRCGEHWPNTTEFFPADGREAAAWCHACREEHSMKRSAA